MRESPESFNLPVQSYYGGLLCCCFSPDGRHVAAAGEDDVVSLYSVRAHQVLAWGEGHASWVSALAFDPWCARTCRSGSTTPTCPPDMGY